MKNIDRPSFARNIIRFRKRKGLSQVDLSNLTGISRRMIAYYETEAINPPIEKIEILAKALGVKISDLIEDSSVEEETTGIDPRILKIAIMLQELNRNDKEYIYGLIKSLHEKTKK